MKPGRTGRSTRPGANLILERYFAPVLRAGHAWPAAQRAGAAASGHPNPVGDSSAAPSDIRSWSGPERSSSRLCLRRFLRCLR